MSGIHKGVLGQIWKPDKEMPIEVLNSANQIMEDAWSAYGTPSQKKRITEMGVWFVGGFCTGLRGDKMVHVELAGTTNILKHLDATVSSFCGAEQ